MKVRRTAFTLVEVAVSCAIVSIILLATQSALVLLVKTTPDGKTGPSARVAAARSLDMIANDLRWATAVTKDTASEIIFTVPDRDGDGFAETIRYVWSGTSGSSLYRQMNGGGSVSIASNVRTFSLTYDTGTVAVSGGTTTSAETLLASYTGSGTASITSNTLNSSAGVGEFFIPSLPSNAISWNVTRVLVSAQGTQSPKKAICTLSTATCGYPATSIATYQTPQLGSSLTWVTFPFTTSGIDPHTGLSFEVLGINPTSTVAIQSQSPGSLSAVGPCFLLQTSNGGSSWSASTNQSLLFYAYGNYTTPNASSSQNVLQDVRCTLQAGSDSNTPVVTDIPVYNAPVLP